MSDKRSNNNTTKTTKTASKNRKVPTLRLNNGVEIPAKDRIYKRY